MSILFACWCVSCEEGFCVVGVEWVALVAFGYCFCVECW